MDDATWGLVDADGYLLDALAPVNQPDPCRPTLRDPNVARGRPASASQTLAGSDPAAAVDGNRETSWVSGSHPPQWLEIDLGGPVTIDGLHLLVDQDPPGPTVHIIEVIDTSG